MLRYYFYRLSVPKPLIPVDGRPLANHWLELLEAADIPKSDIYVVTNAHFYPAFSKWAQENHVSNITFIETQNNWYIAYNMM